MTTTPATTADPSETVLPASTAMDAVTLHVHDLALMSGYYRQALDLQDLDRAAAGPVPAAQAPGTSVVVLGRHEVPLVVLVHTPGLPRPRAGEAGLFHTALLYPTRADLAAVVARAARHHLSRYVGSADHLVSQAFYFTDPEDNGIELYWDRPRDQWTHRDGQVQMANDPLDPNAFLRRHLEEDRTGEAGVGHVHLKVGDIDRARAFYVDALGFEVRAAWPGALFVAAGGYHHHMAMNTWASRGAGARAATIGLGAVAITVPGRSDLDALAGRLRHHQHPHTDDGRTLRFEDPWLSRIEVTAHTPAPQD
ncbi:VOC family protein [uncultured Pseudokineococcus sp.]|uniref:VOC family protein n=1 Tax=uncultured Pseudokineococcus sp. TaxID=1642928 RepID=UPI002636D43E|nr:VOC family protein [uncultured Pseudokineococcus sp.]